MSVLTPTVRAKPHHTPQPLIETVVQTAPRQRRRLFWTPPRASLLRLSWSPILKVIFLFLDVVFFLLLNLVLFPTLRAPSVHPLANARTLTVLKPLFDVILSDMQKIHARRSL